MCFFLRTAILFLNKMVRYERYFIQETSRTRAWDCERAGSVAALRRRRIGSAQLIWDGEGMQRCVIGIDGGGTGIVGRAANAGGVCAEAFGESINGYSNTIASAAQHLKDVLEPLFDAIGGAANCSAICIGAASISNAGMRDAIGDCLRACGYRGAYMLASDMVTALYGAHGGEPGVILISGTGSVCLGCSGEDRFARTGGGGHLIDDVGSAYWIGREILAHALREWDGRSPASAFPSLLARARGIDRYEDLLKFVYDPQTNKRDIAALAVLLDDACGAADSAALEIAHLAAQQLVSLAQPVIDSLSLQAGRVALEGGVLRKCGFVRDEVVRLLTCAYPMLTVGVSRGTPADGALYLADRLAQTPDLFVNAPFVYFIRGQR